MESNGPNLRKWREKKTNFGPDFDANLILQHFFVSFTSTNV